MSIRKTLQQPFPYNPSPWKKAGTAVLFGLFVFIFLLLFKPFGLGQFVSGQIFRMALGYGGVTFVCVLLTTTLIPLMFPKTFDEKTWTTGKQILFMAFVIFLVGLLNLLISPSFVDTPINWERAIWFQGITLTVGLLPVILFVLVRQSQLLKKYSLEASAIDGCLRNKAAMPSPSRNAQPLSGTVYFTGDYQNEKLELAVDDLCLITTANNYIKIYHQDEKNVRYTILRSTLRKAEEVVFPYPQFFKCHRAFLVNLDKVIHVEGNAQGYKVRIEGYDENVPVSRNLAGEFSDRLLSHRGQLA